MKATLKANIRDALDNPIHTGDLVFVFGRAGARPIIVGRVMAFRVDHEGVPRQVLAQGVRWSFGAWVRIPGLKPYAATNVVCVPFKIQHHLLTPALKRVLL